MTQRCVNVNRIMNSLCIFGKNSVICQKLLPKIQNYDAFDRQQFDVRNFRAIESFDFSGYDTVINFAGHSRGSYKSPIENSYQNYVDQIEVNFTSNILIAKKFCSVNPQGRYIWISSSLVKSCRPYQAVYGASKSATELVFEKWQQEYQQFKFITLRIGRCKTNHMYNTFEHTRSFDTVDDEYNLTPYLTADQVAEKLFYLLDIKQSITEEMLP